MSSPTRRDFLKSGAALAVAAGAAGWEAVFADGLAALAERRLRVAWVQGQACSGCSVSLLNAQRPTIDEAVRRQIDLAFHPVLSAAQGERAIALLDRVERGSEPFVLVVEGAVPAEAPIHAVETKEVERRGVDLVLATEGALNRQPVEQPFNNKGFDILSTTPEGVAYRIEVKARIEGATDFFITHNEVMTAKNASPHYRLALVSVSPDGPEYDQVRYLADPFASTDLGDFDATGIRGDWTKTWAKGESPF